MLLNKYLDINPEVAAALAAGKPVVALESTIISHGMPYPQNVETALLVEQTVRESGAVPATIAIIGGKISVGISKAQIEYLGKVKKKEIYHVFRYTSNSDNLGEDLQGKWLIGWSNNEGGTFSNFDLYSNFEQKTVEKTLKVIKRKLL